MNQKKTGMFLKELRKEKQLTQEQLAEILGVTNRSVSRWENGVNMPDLDLVIEIANYYGVGIEEILDGERKSKIMDKKTEQRLSSCRSVRGGIGFSCCRIFGARRRILDSRDMFCRRRDNLLNMSVLFRFRSDGSVKPSVAL